MLWRKACFLTQIYSASPTLPRDDRMQESPRKHWKAGYLYTEEAKVKRNPNLRKTGGNILPFPLACLWDSLTTTNYQPGAKRRDQAFSSWAAWSVNWCIGRYSSTRREIFGRMVIPNLTARDIDEERFEFWTWNRPTLTPSWGSSSVYYYRLSLITMKLVYSSKRTF